METGEFSSVLVPVEFERHAPDANADVVIGPFTARALELAGRLAGNGRVILVHARNDGAEHATWMSPKQMMAYGVRAREKAVGHLKAATRQYCPRADIAFVIEPGPPLDVIFNAATTHSPEVIVLAASSRGRLNRAFHGSTADKLIRRAPCPVIVLPSTPR